VIIATTAASLRTWTPLYLLLGGFAVIIVVLGALGHPGAHGSAFGRTLLRIPNSLERLTGIPGWAAATVGTAAFALNMAGVGFYNDVAWHVYTGRDRNLFTAPHTMIILGLFLIGGSALVGILFASLTGVDTRLRWRGVRVPWSTVPLAVLGITAVSGFPLDDLWHLRYGIDVTMWSPTHLLMILGASFTGLAAWLVLAEAGVRPGDGRWPRVVHTALAALTLEGLCAAQGEFRFGVPQFQQLYHPVLICLAAGFALVAARLVLGRGHALVVAVVAFVTTVAVGGGVSGPGFVHPRQTGLFFASALAVELVAWILGTERPLRFALASGVGVATLGLAGEWAWNAHAIQPWNRSLLPSAVLVGGLAAVGSAVIGLAFGRAVQRRPSGLRPATLVAAALAVVVALALPLPRRTGHVSAAVQLRLSGIGQAVVTATVTPANAADHAHWFDALAWQGGGLVVAHMHRAPSAGRGVWMSDESIPIAGKWKTLLRLSRGDELMAIPVYLPADPTIPAPAVPAVNRTVPFVNEQRYLLREQTGSRDWFASTIEVVLFLVAALWAASFVIAATRIGRRPPAREASPRRRRPALSPA
jgi:hypothetical protein